MIRLPAVLTGVLIAAVCAAAPCHAGHRNASNMSPNEEEGRPVEARDISGKKFCWNSGHSGVFRANGDYIKDDGHHPKWSVPEPGVILIGDTYRQTEVLPDGRLH